MRNEFLAYIAVFVLFGAVLLWAGDATLPVVLFFAGLASAILLVAIAGIRRAPRLLVVGERPGEPHPLRDVFDGAYFETWECPGPADRPCPVHLGKPCPISERPVAAVIYRRADEAGPMAPCGKALRVPTLLVEEGTERRPEVAGRDARVGWERGPDAVLATLDELVTV